MAKHKLKQKKVAKGKQVRWGLILLEGVERRNVVNRRMGRPEYFPPSHHAEDRKHGCGRCGHLWAWHDNVWFKMLADGQFVQPRLRCRGGYQSGLSVSACACREVYPG